MRGCSERFVITARSKQCLREGSASEQSFLWKTQSHLLSDSRGEGTNGCCGMGHGLARCCQPRGRGSARSLHGVILFAVHLSVCLNVCFYTNSPRQASDGDITRLILAVPSVPLSFPLFWTRCPVELAAPRVGGASLHASRLLASLFTIPFPSEPAIFVPNKGEDWCGVCSGAFFSGSISFLINTAVRVPGSVTCTILSRKGNGAHLASQSPVEEFNSLNSL